MNYPQLLFLNLTQVKSLKSSQNSYLISLFQILSLSCDRRTFVRAPPSGVTFDFDYASVSSTALALLKEDPKLSEMRYELVPKVVKEDEFWKNYFYRVNLIKQSFDLKDLEDQSPSHHGEYQHLLMIFSQDFSVYLKNHVASQISSFNCFL